MVVRNRGPILVRADKLARLPWVAPGTYRQPTYSRPTADLQPTYSRPTTDPGPTYVLLRSYFLEPFRALA